jgi:hypothetical protein
VTRKQLRDRVVNEIGLQDIEDYDETVLADDLIYQGTIDLLARTRCTVRCVHLQVRKDESTYVLDKSILALVDVEDGHILRLRRDEPGGVRQVGIVVTPEGYTNGAGTRGFTLIRSDLLRVTPTPTADGEVDVWAVLRPSRMDEDSDSPTQDAYGGIPEEYHDAILLYALWHAASYADDESGSQGERYRQLYEGQDGRGGRISLIKSLINRRGTSRAPRGRVRLRAVGTRHGWVG